MPTVSSNSIKFFLALSLLLVSSCGFWQSKTEATPTPPAPEELKTDVPFSTKEPENYQTEIVVTTGGIEDVTFTARNGANRLTIFDYQTKNEFALLNIGGGQTFLINRSQKNYAENESANISDARGETLNDFLTNEWLDQKRGAKFEMLGAENNFTKYRVRLDEALNSEIIISVDEQIGLPVKQEFYSVNGEQKILTLTAELKNFKRQTEASFFEVPKDYRKVSIKEFQEILRRERMEK
ncbi:MAG: hypothetical protein ACR2HG_00085 [Pyrinomonadaceae bacterium]